jgi:decaprenylphospho-beta-D-ribofuranose 2-oxidase
VPAPERAPRTSLAGWGRTAPSAATVVAAGPGDVARLVTGAGERGLIARGLGRSYGDAAQSAGGTVLDPLPASYAVDPAAATLTASAGTSFEVLVHDLLPQGWFVPVTPGTRQVTLGGAIACDVHGKNHHRSGSLGHHVRSLTLVDGTGTTRVVGPDGDDADLFWATVGGMGLTGVVLEATLDLLPVETGWMSVDTSRLPDLDAVMAAMREADRTHTYSVAWIDTLAGGRRLGRSVLTTGEHAPRAALTGAAARDPRRVPGNPLLRVPPVVPPGLVTRASVRAFNEAWFRKAPRHRTGELQPVATFFHPLDGVADWNRLYGPRGFVQYQLVVPDAAHETVRRVLERVVSTGHPSFLSVLKRLGPGNPGMLSFPDTGWTLALDLPVHPGLRTLFAALDEEVVAAGGRVYLAKDARVPARLLPAMYPRLAEFREVRERLDPHHVLRSDLSRRLGL